MKRWHIAILLVFILASGLPLAPAGVATAAPAAPLRIMPLGDSITSAMGGFASYRCWLWKNLTDLGYSFQFVGNFNGVLQNETSTCPYPADMHHEGHSGWTSDYILNGYPGDPGMGDIDDWITAHPADLVLMHIGTAALATRTDHETPQQIRDNISAIINHLRAHNPNITILLAQIIPATPDWLMDADIRTLNGYIAGLASKSTAVSRVVIVDMYSGYDPAVDNQSDGLHPNQSGEQKIANRWTWALINTLGGYERRTFLPMALR